MRNRKPILPLILVVSALIALVSYLGIAQNSGSETKANSRPLKALLIAGGCCHDYVGQHEVLYKGIQERANVRVDVIWTRDKSVNPPFPMFSDPDWAAGYDVVIHDECAAGNRDEKILDNILAAHQTVPSVHLHCAMHSFRSKSERWHKHIGLKSTRHGPHKPIDVQFTNKEHPITAPISADWHIEKDELYNNEDVYDAEPLAMGTQTYDKGGQKQTDVAIVAWTNTKQGARSFSTSLGHYTDVVKDPKYLDLVTRGLLWTTNNLTDAYLQPYTGSNLITEIPANPDPKKAAAAGLPKVNPDKDSIPTTLTAASVQNPPGHFPWHAIDGTGSTRWTAKDGSYPSWLQLEFDKPTTITESNIKWEIGNQWYQYKIESSTDGKAWDLAYDGSTNLRKSDTTDQFKAENTKFLRVTLLKQEKGMWPAIREMQLKGADGKPLKLHPVGDKTIVVTQPIVDPYKTAGNIPAKAVKLEPAEEAAILKDVKVPEGFDVSLFAPWQMANYPVYVGAAPNGDLYVSSDGNGSLGREPGRGRVLRLRDTDADGRADEVIPFIRDIDSPRGLIWDHDRLYLLHPPHISVFYDRDHDGVAEESQRLISDIAFGFEDRPADHTTNGLEMGIDGWIYVAGGDFGFMEATGADGTKLEHRGGGVLRFRPDGTGLELYSTGTRNILATPMSPRLDLFSRDNTNDGGGWDVRFHHLTPLADHGYPRLYKNFDKETIAPLADYGGGSGCGGVYIHEPGFPDKWNDAPYTVDWGRTGSYRHDVEVAGGTYKETAAPEVFIKMTKPTDATVDGMSAVYQSSWKGPGNFAWAGPDQGYIARVTPSGYQPEALPDFAAMSPSELIEALDSPSHIRTLAAQRALLRRGPLEDRAIDELSVMIQDTEYDLADRIAAVFTLTQGDIDGAFTHIAGLEIASDLMPFVIRALADVHIPAGDDTAKALLTRIYSQTDSRAIMESIFFTVQQDLQAHAGDIAQHLASADVVIRHTTYRALAQMGAHEAALEYIGSDDSDTRKAAAWALMRIHKVEVVDSLLTRLATETTLDKRRPLISTLARLYHIEDEWTGDSWGTRPDTRGPYYTLTTWDQSDRILTELRKILTTANDEEASFTLSKLSKNRIPANDALDRMIELALADSSQSAAVVGQLASSPDVPAKALPIVVNCAKDPASSPNALMNAVKILMASDSTDALSGSLAALNTLKNASGARKELETTRQTFLKERKLENHHTALEQLLHSQPSSPEGYWAAMAVTELAYRKTGSPESIEMTQAALDKAWTDPAQKIVLLKAAGDARQTQLKERILAAVFDENGGVANQAKAAARRLKLEIPKQAKPDPTQVEVTALEGKLKFDKATLTVPVGKKITLILHNPDKMAHNLVVTQPGKNKEIAAAAVALGAEGFAKGWLPEHSDIIAATKMLNAGEEDMIEFTLEKPGKYPFVCTFPGHDMTMLGEIVAK